MHLRNGSLEPLVRKHVLETLDGVEWNMNAASRVLGIDRRTLYRWVTLWGYRPRTERARRQLAGAA